MNFSNKITLHNMLHKLFSGLVASVLLVSCTTDPNSPGLEYMPDMYRPQSYEAYLEKYDIDSVGFYDRYFTKAGIKFELLSKEQQDSILAEVNALYSVYNNGTATYKPVSGTVPVGYTPFLVAKTDRDAAKSVVNPLQYNEQNLKEGKVYYNLFCDHCHGEKGDGNGPMVALGVYPVQPPAYNNGPSAELTPGEIYHTIYYGKGVMGSHAAQISEDKRWKIVMYVQTLQGKSLESLGIVAPKTESDSTGVSIESSEPSNEN